MSGARPNGHHPDRRKTGEDLWSVALRPGNPPADSVRIGGRSSRAMGFDCGEQRSELGAASIPGSIRQLLAATRRLLFLERKEVASPMLKAFSVASLIGAAA